MAGQMLRAMEHMVADPSRPLRSFTVHFCALATEGEAEVRVRIERSGKLVTAVDLQECLLGGATEGTLGV